MPPLVVPIVLGRSLSDRTALGVKVLERPAVAVAVVVVVAADVMITGIVGEPAVTGMVVWVGTEADTRVGIVDVFVAGAVGVVESLLAVGINSG